MTKISGRFKRGDRRAIGRSLVGHLPSQGRDRWPRGSLKRVFRIDIEHCANCGGRLKIIASIEDPDVIGRILKPIEHPAEPLDVAHAPQASPQSDLPF